MSVDITCLRVFIPNSCWPTILSLLMKQTYNFRLFFINGFLFVYVVDKRFYACWYHEPTSLLGFFCMVTVNIDFSGSFLLWFFCLLFLSVLSCFPVILLSMILLWFCVGLIKILSFHVGQSIYFNLTIWNRCWNYTYLYIQGRLFY